MAPSVTPVQLDQDNAEQEPLSDEDLSDPDASVPGTSAQPQESDYLHDIFTSPSYELSVLNESVTVLGVSPIDKKKANVSVNYSKHKIRSVETAVRKKLELVRGAALEESEEEEEDTAVSEMIKQLKDKFNMSTRTSEKVQVLTVLPKSWSIRKIVGQFHASNYMARQAKKLVEEKGILSTPNPKSGHFLAKKIVEDVKEFYSCESISRLMPGMKDFVSVNVNGGRQHLQKRLVLCNLKEAYEEFKCKYAQHKIGFSKFAELRPRECVLAGSSGTHAVCVCTTHQNIKLMFQGAKLDSLDKGYTYHTCLAVIQCNPPRIHCSIGECHECPGVGILQQTIERHFDENMIDRIEYKQWTNTDRATLETKIQTADEFTRTFIGSIPNVLNHDFVARQQAQFLQEVKRTLKPCEFLVIGDFAENYSFVVQDAAQSFHWNNLQATLHPFVCYYTSEPDVNNITTLKHVSFVVISENSSHDTIAVHLFQKVLINFLSKKITTPQKMIYFSDGCAAQYKNRKNFVNLCNHGADFGMSAEWHFFATSHGKGPCDGVGGTVKRMAARASLQRPLHDQILTPRQLFDFAVAEIKTVNFYYATVDEYEKETELLKTRLESARTIPGTHRLHCFLPVSADVMEVRDFSSSPIKRLERVIQKTGSGMVNIARINGYVTAMYDGAWWLAYVLNTLSESAEVELNFLHPHGPSRSFSYPSRPDKLVISLHDILTVVDPKTVTGRMYSLSTDEMAAATRAATNH